MPYGYTRSYEMGNGQHPHHRRHHGARHRRKDKELEKAQALVATDQQTRPSANGDGPDVSADDHSLDKAPIPSGPRPVSTPMSLPRADYLRSVDQASTSSSAPVEPKSKLLISDLDNTLFGPSGPDSVVARPYLKTFIQYIMHPDTPYNLALWTFSGRLFGLAHLRSVGMGKYLFDSDSLDAPKLKKGLLAFWGYEDSGFLRNGLMAAGKPLKDLDLMWSFINLTRSTRGDEPEYGSSNSLIVDDQVTNARAQPDSIVEAPVFTSKSPDDDFLLAFIGVLEDLARQSNIASAISAKHLFTGIALEDLDRYVAKAKTVCSQLGIKVSRGTAYPDPTFVEEVKQQSKPSGPVHDAAEEPTEPHPGSLPFARPTPKRLAKGMLTGPSPQYRAEAAEPSEVVPKGTTGKPLIVFDLDGTTLEHDPNGQASGRPYLRTFLQWLLRDDSPWSMAIWTGSQKATAVRCLYELDLGLVGPKLIEDEAELLHPKLVALWAREDLGLTPQDYVSYVSVVKDLDKLWDHLHQSGKGSWDPHNTAMADDTPSKLRAQPDTLIAAPTYDYPLEPSPATNAAQLDTFLLSLVAMLDELTPEDNFSNYINGEGWNSLQRPDALNALNELRDKGVKLLRKAGIPIAAEGRGLINGVLPSVNESGVRNAKPVNAVQVFRPTSSTPSSSSTPLPLTTANLARESGGHTTDVGSDTDNKSDTTASVNGDTDSSPSPVDPPSPPGTRAATTPNTSSSSHSGRFVNEIEAMEAARGRQRPQGRSARKRLEDATEDWENFSDDPDAVPTEVPSPFYQQQAQQRSRRDSMFS
ncbi:hypothetical protein JCM10213v2_005485 [Rhodosporidiobolus nylandii]